MLSEYSIIGLQDFNGKEILCTAIKYMSLK